MKPTMASVTVWNRREWKKLLVVTYGWTADRAISTDLTPHYAHMRPEPEDMHLGNSARCGGNENDDQAPITPSDKCCVNCGAQIGRHMIPADTTSGKSEALCLNIVKSLA
jgi:hypothetical protein